MKVVLLSGGGGGARFARGLDDALEPGELTVIGNVGDDVEILGLHVSPDLDSLLYTLAGLIDHERGWGRAGETWNALESAGSWGGESWFRLGDLDVGLHLVRTQALREGEPLSEVTSAISGRPGSQTRILPATDDQLRTKVVTPAGTFPFQEWYVGRGHRDDVDAVEYDGAAKAQPRAGRARGARSCRRDPHRPQQPVSLDRADSCRRADPPGDRAPTRALRRGQPARRRRARSPARPTVCSRAWQAAPPHAM